MDMERNLLQHDAAQPCFGGSLAKREQEIFERIREEIAKLDDNRNLWKTAHHLRVSSILNGTEMYLYPFRWDECFGYHVYRWSLWLPIRSMFWKVFSPPSATSILSEQTIKTIIDLLLPFYGFIPHTSIYELEKLPLTGTKLTHRVRFPYNLSLVLSSDELRLDKEPYFLTPEIETRSLLLLLDIFDTMYWHHDPDLRNYSERFNYKKMYKKYIIQSTRLLHHEGAISSDVAYNRIMKLFTTI
ncbi:MAG: hypothetical protein QXX84_06890 [Sulfolobales archaeon]